MPSSSTIAVRPVIAIGGQAPTVALTPPLDLLELARRLVLCIAFRYAQGFGQILIDEALRARTIGNGTKRELGLPGHPDFAHEHGVERCGERLAISKPTATPPRGSAKTTGCLFLSGANFAASSQPAAARSANFMVLPP